MDKTFRLTKVTKFSDGDETKILSDIVLSDKLDVLFIKDILAINNLLAKS